MQLTTERLLIRPMRMTEKKMQTMLSASFFAFQR